MMMKLRRTFGWQCSAAFRISQGVSVRVGLGVDMLSKEPCLTLSEHSVVSGNQFHIEQDMSQPRDLQ